MKEKEEGEWGTVKKEGREGDVVSKNGDYSSCSPALAPQGPFGPSSYNSSKDE